MEIVKRKIAELKFDRNNARLHSVANLSAIKGSLAKFGQQKPIVINKSDDVVAGNGTLEAAIALGWTEIDCYVTPLDETDQRAFALADNRTAELASWDFDILNETLKNLDEYGVKVEDFGFDIDFVKWVEESIDSARASTEARESEYTKKIETPIYTPRGEKPSLTELVDRAKMSKLIDEINNADIPDDVKAFLAVAAARHLVFSYQKIAEYYAHAPAKVQDLMEKSALVIIDFNKAIENGYVKLSSSLAGAYAE